MRRWFYFILATVAAWLAFFALISTLPVLSGVFTWQQAFRMTLNQWFPWVLLSPLIVWFTLRWPLEWKGWPWRVSAHLAVGVISVIACAWLNESFALAPVHPLDGRPDGSRFENHPPRFENPPPEMDEDQPPMSGSPRSHLHPQHHGPPLWARAGFNIPVYLTIFSLSHAFIYFRRTQQRERHALELETQLGQARLQTLRMQLQPHFLFNTLNAISTLVQTNPPVAQEMIGSLGQMLRLSLDSGSNPEVPLEHELKFLDCYLEIAQTRFGDRLQVKHEIAPDTGRALVPTFVLQPLVENAVRHGIEPGLGPGTIELSVRKRDGWLSISIRDTGVGLAESASGGVTAQNGIGIANTRARLESLYPGRHQFSVRNDPRGGCIAELEIPFHTKPLAVSTESKVA